MLDFLLSTLIGIFILYLISVLAMYQTEKQMEKMGFDMTEEKQTKMYVKVFRFWFCK